MTARSESSEIYAAARHWSQRCLLGEGSILLETERVWTAENFRHLNTDFVENLKEEEGSFIDKLHEQLGKSPPDAQVLAGEMLWLMMLFPNNISFEAKLRLVRAPLEWAKASLSPENRFIRVLAQGVGSTGQAYNQHRWRELTLLIRAMVAWGGLNSEERHGLLSNPWGFAEWLDKTPDANKRQIRNILLHLLFPNVFERVSTFQHKRLIVRHYAPAWGIELPRESVSLPVDAFDRPLHALRERLQSALGREFDFYDDDLEAEWRPAAQTERTGKAATKKQAPHGGDATALEKRLDPGVRWIVGRHVKLATAIPELRRRPTVGLLATALIRTYEENRLDTADALWKQIKPDSQPATPTAVADFFKLPPELVAEAGSSTSDDVDVDALLRSNAGSELLGILERADACAHAVTGEVVPQVSLRHLIGAILEPGGGENEAKRALVERGFRLATLRAAVMAFFQERLKEDDLEKWREYLDVEPPRPVLPEPGYARDYIDPEVKTLGPDELGVDNDVKALARLLCATSAEPPISVGLFGDWGTGKSTFMQRLDWHIRDLSAQAERAERRKARTAYRSGVVSIWFNAWHYMDANLWASLVTHIFNELARYLSGDAGEHALEQMRKSLYGQLAASQALLREAQGREQLAGAAVTEAEQRADAARRQQADLVHRLDRARNVAAGLWQAVTDEVDATPVAAYAGSPPTEAEQAAMAVDAALSSVVEQARSSAQEAARELGLIREKDGREPSMDPRTTVANIRGTLAQMQGLWGNLSASAEILHRRRGLLFDVGIGLFVLAAVAVPLVLVGPERVRAWIAALAALSPIVVGLNVVAAKVRRVLERADANIQASTDRAAMEANALQSEVDRLKQAADAADRDRLQAQQQVDQIQSEIEDIRAGRRLEQFIRDRAGSDDYRQHLGIIATIRQDFEALARLLTAVRMEGAAPAGDGSAGDAAGSPPAVEGGDGGEAAEAAYGVRRIVLYIDDLDRCPEARVVEVLQAVHLLLAFPLFVVVVGVDSRWLLRAVQSQYERLLTSERDTAKAGVPTEDAGHWASTPQNYLEKIFQIPFTLEPMGADGFGRLLGSLVKVRPPPPVAAKEGQAQGDGEGTGGSPPPDEEGDGGAPGLDADWVMGESEEEEDLPLGEEDEDARLNPPGLEVEPWELKYLSGLAPLIGSPRMAKRFANVYRFIRAALAGPELDGFRGTEEAPGQFRAVGLLLALLTGFAGEAVELFRELIEEEPEPGEDWTGFVRRVAERTKAAGAAAPATSGGLPARRWDRLRDALERVEQDPRVSIDASLEPYRKWAPRVARFSFQTVQLVGRRAPQSPPDGHHPPAPA